MFFFFFFQAEDGIRDLTVTGVQTCALPISMNPEELLALAEKSSSFAWQQRLGYLLEIVGANKLAEVLKKHLSKQKRLDYILLTPGRKVTKQSKKNNTWKLIENTKIESDI